MYFLTNKFLVLEGGGYGLCAIGGPVVGISILNGLVLPTSVEDLDVMLSNSFYSKEESLSIDSSGTLAFCNITHCHFKLLCSGWKLDSGGRVRSSVQLWISCFCPWYIAYFSAFNFNWIQCTEQNCSRNMHSITCSFRYGVT